MAYNEEMRRWAWLLVGLAPWWCAAARADCDFQDLSEAVQSDQWAVRSLVFDELVQAQKDPQTGKTTGYDFPCDLVQTRQLLLQLLQVERGALKVTGQAVGGGQDAADAQVLQQGQGYGNYLGGLGGILKDMGGLEALLPKTQNATGAAAQHPAAGENDALGQTLSTLLGQVLGSGGTDLQLQGLMTVTTMDGMDPAALLPLLQGLAAQDGNLDLDLTGLLQQLQPAEPKQ